MSQAFVKAALSRRFDFLAFEDSTDSATYVRLGECTVDLTLFTAPLQGLSTRVVKFVVDLDILSGGGAPVADVKLYNLTDLEDVTGTNLTHNTNVNTEKSSAALVIGAGAGQFRPGLANYVAYLKMVGGAAGVDRVFCTNARITLDYTP